MRANSARVPTRAHAGPRRGQRILTVADPLCRAWFWFGTLAAASCAPASHEPLALDDLPTLLDSLRSEFEVPGVAFAAFDDTGTLLEYVGGDGRAGTPMGPNTLLEAASISKPVFAYLVLTLAAEGLIDLDAPLSSLVSEVPEVGYDPRSSKLTPRLLLSHQGGLPNWRTRINLSAGERSDLFDAGDTLRFVAEPGEAFIYSGEGYVLLQQVVEEVTGTELTELADTRIFEPLGMDRSVFQFDTGLTDYALGHDAQGQPNKFGLGVPLASSTLHSTAADLARFGSHLAREVRSGGLAGQLATPAVATEEGEGLRHSWGLGLGIVDAGPRRYVYHGGNNVIFIADFIYGVEENLGYVLLTNSSNGAALVEPVERHFFGRSLHR